MPHVPPCIPSVVTVPFSIASKIAITVCSRKRAANNGGTASGIDTGHKDKVRTRVDHGTSPRCSMEAQFGEATQSQNEDATGFKRVDN